ncbi:MAG: DNA adenine methylase, partial [Deltaproteobacteria bacterium]|nr:DNA adenine methylase [Deltaproteobacteria bacterium]
RPAPRGGLPLPGGPAPAPRPGGPYLKSPFNYIGGKHRLLPQILPLFPPGIGTFVDLFAGGCDVGINVPAERVVFNDINVKVIGMYRAFRERPAEEILERVDRRVREYGLDRDNPPSYAAFRLHYNRTGDPLDLFALACHSYNYMFRFNSRLEYNNTYGRGRSRLSAVMRRNLLSFLERIKRPGVTFTCADFAAADVSGLGPDDLVYCDPPYLIAQGSHNDGARGFKRWREAEEEALHGFLDSLDARGVRFALSNVLSHKGALNRILLGWCRKYRVACIASDYSNSSYNARKGGSLEVLITNYAPPPGTGGDRPACLRGPAAPGGGAETAGVSRVPLRRAAEARGGQPGFRETVRGAAGEIPEIPAAWASGGQDDPGSPREAAAAACGGGRAPAAAVPSGGDREAGTRVAGERETPAPVREAGSADTRGGGSAGVREAGRAGGAESRLRLCLRWIRNLLRRL